ncbi:hypothetical protein AcV7_000961 [Taiwanofungus camphoratus]|nr:hypothetical protein AcV7_000961 [Antrodia cinnamomea]
MERRMYLHAAWLFLLARVVHRALIRDEEVENSWHACGIIVSERLPLVQRQWDIVSQFRSQVTHRATLSLREHATSPGEVCAALLTLHLLESRPLPETLVIFLGQRSKTISTVLSRTQESLANANPSEVPGMTSIRSRKAELRGAKQKLQAVLDIVSRTLGAARTIFADSTETDHLSMMKLALQYIQTEKLSFQTLPTELQITTQSLLTTLPSSAHYLLLPPIIRSYRPYVDGVSPMSPILQSELHQKLGSWFHQTMEDVLVAMEGLFSRLQSIREVWELRFSSWRWLEGADAFEIYEKTHIKSAIDEISQQRITAVWKSALAVAEVAFIERLASALTLLRDHSDSSGFDTRPNDYMFQSLPIPLLSQNPSVATASFSRYKSALTRQLRGRTPLLEDVVHAVQDHANGLQEDLNAMQGDDEVTRILINRLSEMYRPDADALSMRVATALEDTASDIPDDSDCYMRTLVFLGRIANEFVCSSTFVNVIGCSPATIDKFQRRMSAIYHLTIERWRENAIRRLTEGSYSIQLTHEDTFNNVVPAQPSSALMQALFSLSTSMQELGVNIDPTQCRRLVWPTFRSFVNKVQEYINGEVTYQRERYLQYLWDLTFLRVLARLWGVESTQDVQSLDMPLSRITKKLIAEGTDQSQLDMDKSLSDYLARTQILLSHILPQCAISLPAQGKTERSASLLHHGLPVVEQQYQPAVEVVKPSPRFGLLLVDNTPVL